MAIAIVVGSLLTLATVWWFPTDISFIAYWGSLVLAVFWFSFGGHWTEIIYLNYIRMALPESASIEFVTRLLIWYIGGCPLFAGMKATLNYFDNSLMDPVAWWLGGGLFIFVELIVHSILTIFGRNSLWNGRG